MYAAERQHLIADQARSRGRVEVAALAEQLAVTPETIRRDLAVLVRRGLLQRAHGGAIPAERTAGFESDIGARAHVMAAEKARIATAALEEVPSEGAVFVEAGSTPGALAELLPRRPLTVITTGLLIAHSLAGRTELTVLLTGGRIRGRTQACVDDWALQRMAGVHVDVAFLGTNGISPEHGLTTPDSAEAAIKRAALGLARRTVLLADHSKLGAVSVCRYGDLPDVDLLVTDSEASDEDLKELSCPGEGHERGVEVITA